MKSQIESNLNLEFLKTPVKRVQSELSISRRSLIKEIDNEVRSVSSYFKEFRKNSELKNFLSLAHAKGRNFDYNKVHDIVNVGNLKPLLEADERIQSQRKTPSKNWGAQRMLAAFVAATEIKTTK